MKLKTKIFMGALGGLAVVATPAALLASCSDGSATYKAPTGIKQVGLKAFEGTATNPTTALASAQIVVDNLNVTLTTSLNTNTYLSFELPTTLAQFTGHAKFTDNATITWALNTQSATNFEIVDFEQTKRLTNKVALGTNSFMAQLTGNITEGTQTEKFTLNVEFKKIAPTTPTETETTTPTVITKEGLTATEGATANEANTNLDLSNAAVATFTGLEVKLTATAAANKFIKLTLPNTIGETFTGQTGFTKAAAISWVLQDTNDANFTLTGSELVNKSDLTTAEITTTLVGTITESGKQTKTFNVTVKFVGK